MLWGKSYWCVRKAYIILPLREPEAAQRLIHHVIGNPRIICQDVTGRTTQGFIGANSPGLRSSLLVAQLQEYFFVTQ